MGHCLSSRSDVSLQIDATIRRDASVQILKLLFLGSGESGKSTILKQIILSKDSDVEDSQLQSKNRDAFKNLVLVGMNSLLRQAQIEDKIPKGKEIEHATAILTEAHDIGPLEVPALTYLWKQDGIQDVLKKKYQPELEYFMSDIEKFLNPDYIMTREDILHVRQKTTGVRFYDVPGLDGRQLCFVDVGGQRSERRKWISAFDDVVAVIYVSALDSYDLTLEEDTKTNRLDDDIRLFVEVTSSKFLPKVWFFVHNKSDLLKKKLKTSPLSSYFPDVDKDKEDDIDYAVGYLRSKFLERIDPGSIRIFFHVTCALNTHEFESLHSIICSNVNAVHDI
eukprot:TRINITY_DN7810_c0_g2_i1.p1 TRINITY_DN7810_c0_g2~~TRINITY_DN7810_c0_g2_i1.p1  ORF type:complete len:336 (+),score=54.93 TRINITY_DN7810_c0_g2_i1:178-1185(+)